MTTLLESPPLRMQPGSTEPALRVERSTLVQRALEMLIAAENRSQYDSLQIEERAVYQPDSWLIQRCWEALADAGAAHAALSVASISARRQPLTPVQALYRLSKQIDRTIGLANLIRQELTQVQPQVMATAVDRDETIARDRLLYTAATAAAIGEAQQAFTFLERLDQFAAPWERPIVVPEQRQVLADTLVRLGVHPLSMALISSALRRYDDAGAQFVLIVTTAASEHLRKQPASPRMARLLALGVDAFRHATLTSLHSRRLTAIALAQAGAIDEVMGQLIALANIQAARRESGLSLRKGDQNLLRQVKRPTADADIDFQAYTMQEVVKAMPVRQIPREQRIELADRLAVLGAKSDGWTAAGAASTLIELGAVKYAVEVVESIAAKDPTKAEGYIGLVRGLLTVEEPALAQEQIGKGLEWVHSYPGRNPARALIWGLAELFLERREPAQALAILDTWEEPSDFWRSVRDLFGRKLSDDELRNNGLRLRAMLQQDAQAPKAVQQQLDLLLIWAPRLLDGEALVNFLIDNVLAPLLSAGRIQQAISTLPLFQRAMMAGSGEKHAIRLGNLSRLLVAELTPALQEQIYAGGGNGRDETASVRAALEAFITEIWQADSRRGLWQTIHGIEGVLPMLIALDGPEAVVSLARGVEQAGARWNAA
ncbi:MAG: hypothetical protein R6W76_06455 [Caldilinea sp.]